jgi:hypothetical protein
MKSLKNLWGEPVALWGALIAIATMAISFDWLSGIGIEGQDDMARVLAVLSALSAIHIALFTHCTLVGLIVPTVTAFVNFGVIYGTHISAEQTATIVAGITAVGSALHWWAQTPTAEPSLSVKTP